MNNDDICQCDACIRRRAMHDRTHMPPFVRKDPNARSWHWNEHPQGKWPEEARGEKR